MSHNIYIKIKNRDILRYISIFFITILPNLSSSQQISSKLDSIHQLEINELDKTLFYNKLLESHKQKEDYTQLGSDAHQIAKWIRKLPRRRPEAIAFVEKAIEARKKAIPYNSKLLKSSYNNLGYYNYLEKNYKAAIKAHKKVLSINDNQYLYGFAHHYIGKCYALLEDPAQAIESYRKAFKFYKKNKKKRIILHNDIANSYKIMANFNDAQIAINHLQIADSLILSSTKINKSILFKVHNTIAGLYLENIKDTLQADKHFQKTLIIAKELNKKTFISGTHYNIGLLNLSTDNEKALHHFNQCLLYANTDQYFNKLGYFGLGLVKNQTQNYKEATTFYYKSISFFFNKKINSQNINKILTEKELSLNTDKLLLIEVLREVINNFIDLGKHTNKEEYYQEAFKLIKIIDNTIDVMLKSKTSYNTKLLLRNLISSIYTNGIEICTQTNQVDYGFYLSEKNKALLLMQEISKANKNIPTKITEKTTQLEREIIYLKNTYKTASDAKDSISSLTLIKEAILEKYQDSISTIYPNYSTIKKIPTIVPLRDITINNNELIIQYIMTEKLSSFFLDTYCLILSKDHKKLYRLENSKTLQDKIYAIRKQLEVPFKNEKDIKDYKKKAHELYLSLIPEEIRPLLKNKKITIITDHLLNTIPFESLVSDLDSGRYLIEDSEIRYTYSLSFEKQNAQKARNAKKDFLGIAPINFSDDLITLKNSKKELRAANSYYPGTLLLNKEATKENFINQVDQYKIIHLATHANASDSIAPWIAFSNQKLVASELGLLDHQAEMVVLSACNTSLGEVRSGEGVMSLARGFFKSGAKSVIPSLWSTNDKATASITSNFYKNLSTGQTKSAALRTAKLNYLNNHTDAEASPHYWAPLVLIGANDVILPAPNYIWLWYLLFGMIVVIAIGVFYKKRKT